MYKYKLTNKLQQLREEEEASKPQYIIYCDMDGVIADFDKRFEQFFKMSPREYESKFGKEQFWDVISK